MMTSPRRKNHQPKGPGGTWKTGQRVPFTSNWVDQHGVVSLHFAGDTFPATVGFGGGNECAYRQPFASAVSHTG